MGCQFADSGSDHSQIVVPEALEQVTGNLDFPNVAGGNDLRCDARKHGMRFISPLELPAQALSCEGKEMPGSWSREYGAT